MAISSSDIRAGKAYVEITAEDKQFQAGLKRVEARLKEWVHRNKYDTSKVKEAAFGGRNLNLENFLAIGAAVAAAKGTADLFRGAMAAARGDAEGIATAIEQLPLGLGATVRSLAELYADLGGITADIERWGEYARRAREVEGGFGKGLKRLAELREELTTKAALAKLDGHALELARARLDADKQRQRIRDEAKKAGIGEDHPRVAAALVAVDAVMVGEQSRAARKEIESQGRDAERVGRLIAEAQAEYARLTMSERDFLAYQVERENLSAGMADTLLRLRQANLEVTEEQKRAQEGLNALMAQADADAAAWARSMQDAVDADQKRYDEAYTLTQAMQTPREKAGDEIAKYRQMIEEGLIDPETYRRAVRSTIEDLAATMPETREATVEARGTYSGLMAQYMGAGGPSAALVDASRETAEHTKKIARLMEKFGITYS